VRLSLESEEQQTSQLHAIMGTPIEVPVPSSVIFKILQISNEFKANLATLSGESKMSVKLI
jgi:hypothetical protein